MNVHLEELILFTTISRGRKAVERLRTSSEFNQACTSKIRLTPSFNSLGTLQALGIYITTKGLHTLEKLDRPCPMVGLDL